MDRKRSRSTGTVDKPGPQRSEDLGQGEASQRDRLERFLAAAEGEVPLRALTLHMLEYVAPRMFRARGLAGVQARALEECLRVELDYRGDPVALQAGVDAWYCRFLKGLPHQPPSAKKLGEVLRTLAGERDPLSPPGERENEVLFAWLIGEQAARCGVDVRVPLEPRPFKGTHPLHDAYWLTHLVMLDTDYFAKPLTHPDAAEWGDELSALVPWLEQNPNDDLAGEVALCLHFMKRDARAALELVRRAAPTEDAHAQATALLALSAE